MVRASFFALMATCIMLLSACSSAPAVVGRWDAVLQPTPTPLPTPTPEPNADPGKILSDLLGVLTSPIDIQIGCEAIYPTSVEFFKDGTFTSGPGGLFSGKYEVLEGKRLKLQTAAGITALDFTLSNNTLSIRYDDKCTLTYRRAE